MPTLDPALITHRFTVFLLRKGLVIISVTDLTSPIKGFVTELRDVTFPNPWELSKASSPVCQEKKETFLEPFLKPL